MNDERREAPRVQATTARCPKEGMGRASPDDAGVCERGSMGLRPAAGLIATLEPKRRPDF